MDSWYNYGYFNQYNSPNIVIIPTDLSITMPQPQHNYVRSSAIDPRLLKHQIQTNDPALLPQTQANLKNQHLIMPPPTTIVIDKGIELKQSFSNSHSQVRNNLITLTDTNTKTPDKYVITVTDRLNNNQSINNGETGDIKNKSCSEHKIHSNGKDSNTKIKDTEDHSKISSKETEKNNSYNSRNCSKQNYNGTNTTDAQKREKRKIDEECTFKHTNSPSDLKKKTAVSENLKISQQECATSSNIGPKHDKLSNTSNQKQSAGTLKHYLDYQKELRKLKTNTSPKVKDTESVTSDENKSLDTNKISNQFEDSKKKKESTSKLDKSVVSRGVNHVNHETFESEKSYKRSKNTANESKTTNSNRKSSEKTPKSTEFNKNKNRAKTSSYKAIKDSMNEQKKTKAQSLEKEKRKRKSKDDPTVLELKKRKEDHREARSHSESKKKKQISEKFAQFLEIRKKKEERKNKTEEESKKKLYDELELKKTSLASKDHSSYTQKEEQQESTQQTNPRVKNVIRKEKDRFNRDRSNYFNDTQKSIKEYNKKSKRIVRKEPTKAMKEHTSLTLSPTEMKTKKASPIKEKHLKSQGYYKSVKSMIINPTKIKNERNTNLSIRKEDVSKYDQSNKINNKMDLRTMLIRKRAKDNAAKLKRLRTKKPEQDNFVITLQQDVTANSKPAMMTHISGKTKSKKNKKVKLLISIVCDSEDSDDSGETETKYSSSPFEDLSFLDDINVDEIVNSLEQKGTMQNENQSSVQRIQNLLKKDAENSFSDDKINGIDRKSRLMNIVLNNRDSSEILHSSDNKEYIFEESNTDSKKDIINIASKKLIDDDVVEVIDITDDMDNDTIVIEHNVEELIEELFASPTKENFNEKSNSEEISKGTAITFGDESKQYIQSVKKLEEEDLDANLKQNTTMVSDSNNLRLDEPQKIETNLKSQFNEDNLLCKDDKNNIMCKAPDYLNFPTSNFGDSMELKESVDSLHAITNIAKVINKQPKTKFAPEILSSSEEPQNELIYANQSLDVVMSDVPPYFSNTKNDSIEYQDAIKSKNVNKAKLISGLACDELAVNNKFVKKHLDDQNTNLAEKNKTQYNTNIVMTESLLDVILPQDKRQLATCGDNIAINKTIKCPYLNNKETQNIVANVTNVAVDDNTNANSDQSDTLLSDVNNANNVIDIGATNTTKMGSANHLSGSNQPETKKLNNHFKHAIELNIENVESQSDCMKFFNEDLSLDKHASNQDNLSEINDVIKSNDLVEYVREINNKNIEWQRYSKENAYEGVLLHKDAPERYEDNLPEINDALAACIKNTLDEKICVTAIIKRGFFSKVYRCNDDKGKLYAFKMLRFPEKGRYLNEIHSLLNKSTTDNCYNLQMICAMEVSGRYCFLSDYYPKTLQDALARRNKGFHIELVQKLAKQLVSAVTVLTVNNIIHTDIKTRHILLNKGNNNIKLCGFDAAVYSQDINISPNWGMPYCRAPETILGFHPGFGVDVWAIALVIFEMATKSRLITGRNNHRVLYNQLRISRTFDYEILKECQFGHLYFKGTEFLPLIVEKKQELLPPCTDTNLLAMKLFESYDKQWRPSRQNWQADREMNKMEMLFKLLQQMVEMNPRERIPITHVLSDKFFKNIP